MNKLEKIYHSAIFLNHSADIKAFLLAVTISHKLDSLLLKERNDNWQAVNKINDNPIYTNIHKYITISLTKLQLEKIKQENKEFSRRFFHLEVSIILSTITFNSNNPQLFSLADFIHKIFDKSLSTRNYIKGIIKYNKESYTLSTKKIKLANKYSDNFCVFCYVNKNTIIVKDTKHIFSDCPQHLHLNNTLITNITSNQQISPLSHPQLLSLLVYLLSQSTHY
jgi:hypothetical protein